MPKKHWNKLKKDSTIDKEKKRRSERVGLHEQVEVVSAEHIHEMIWWGGDGCIGRRAYIHSRDRVYGLCYCCVFLCWNVVMLSLIVHTLSYSFIRIEGFQIKMWGWRAAGGKFQEHNGNSMLSDSTSRTRMRTVKLTPISYENQAKTAITTKVLYNRKTN